MEKNLLFDVCEALQMGGYSDDVVLNTFVASSIKAAFGEDWGTAKDYDVALDGRFITIYFDNLAEFKQMLSFVESETSFKRSEQVIRLLSHRGDSKCICLICV